MEDTAKVAIEPTISAWAWVPAGMAMAARSAGSVTSATTPSCAPALPPVGQTDAWVVSRLRATFLERICWGLPERMGQGAAPASTTA